MKKKTYMAPKARLIKAEAQGHMLYASAGSSSLGLHFVGGVSSGSLGSGGGGGIELV